MIGKKYADINAAQQCSRQLNTKVDGGIFNNRPPSSVLSSYDDFTGSFSLAGAKSILTSGSEDNTLVEEGDDFGFSGTYT